VVANKIVSALEHCFFDTLTHASLYCQHKLKLIAWRGLQSVKRQWPQNTWWASNKTKNSEEPIDENRTYFEASSVHFLSHVHSGISVIQLYYQNKSMELLSQLSLLKSTFCLLYLFASGSEIIITVCYFLLLRLQVCFNSILQRQKSLKYHVNVWMPTRTDFINRLKLEPQHLPNTFHFRFSSTDTINSTTGKYCSVAFV